MIEQIDGRRCCCVGVLLKTIFGYVRICARLVWCWCQKISKEIDSRFRKRLEGRSNVSDLNSRNGGLAQKGGFVYLVIIRWGKCWGKRCGSNGSCLVDEEEAWERGKRCFVCAMALFFLVAVWIKNLNLFLFLFYISGWWRVEELWCSLVDVKVSFRGNSSRWILWFFSGGSLFLSIFWTRISIRSCGGVVVGERERMRGARRKMSVWKH